MNTEIQAMPKMIHLDSNEVKVQQQRIQKLFNQGKLTYVEDYKGAKMYHEGNQNVFSWSLFDESELIYFVQVRTVELFNGKAVRQTLVRRNKANGKSVKFAQYIVFNKLLPIYGTVASDCQQSEDGQRLWHFLVDDALLKGLKVTVLNTNDKTEDEFVSLPEFLHHKVWGSADWFQRIVIVISAK